MIDWEMSSPNEGLGLKKVDTSTYTDECIVIIQKL